MSIQIKLKNSVVQDSTPSTSDLPAVGEIALNANINSIGGFMRASNNTIVKIFGPGSLTTPTATTTVSGISELATNAETTTGTATNRVVTPAGLNAVTVAERTTSNNNYVAKAGSTMTGVLTATAGSNSAPAINFGDSDSGIFGGTNTVSLTAGGTTRLTADTGVSVVGTLAVTGAITSTSDLTIADKIIHAGDTNTAVRFPAADTVSVETNSLERARINSSGKLLIGTSTARAHGGINGLVQIEGTSLITSSMSITRNSNDNQPPFFVLSKTRGSSLGGTTVVQDDDVLGAFRFTASDGTDTASFAAAIKAEVDGTPGSNDVPGRLVFMTTADGAASPTERLRIASGGLVTVAGALTTTNGAITANVGTNNQVIIGGDGSIEISRNGGGAFIDFKNDPSEDQDARIQENNGGFDLSGNVNIGNGCDVTGHITGTGDLTIDTSTLKVDSTNNRVGIGISSPDEILHIKGPTETIGSRDGVLLQHSTASNAADNGLPLVWSGYISASNTNYGLASICGRKENSTDNNGAAYLQFGTGSSAGAISERMRIDSAGNVAIGTTSASHPLHVKTSSVSNSKICVESTGSNSYPAFKVTNDARSYEIGIDGSTDGLRFYDANADVERMRITTLGRVGIGTTNPDHKLDVVGNIAAKSTDTFVTISGSGSIEMRRTGGAFIDFSTATGEDHDCRIKQESDGLAFTTGGNGSANEKMRITSGGVIEINRGSSTDAAIDINTTATSGATRFRFRQSSADKAQIAYSHDNNLLELIGMSGNGVAFVTNGFGNERMRILSGGAVVVAGTTAYSDGTFGEAKLQFNTKSGNHIGACSVADTTNSITHVLFKNPNGAIASFGTHNSDFIALTGNAERLRIDSNGDVGIGTNNPVAKLDVESPNLGTTSGNQQDLIRIKSPDVQNDTRYFFRNFRFQDGNTHTSSELRLMRKVDVTDMAYLGLRDGSMTFGYGSSEKMRMRSDGNFGINVTNPTQKLHIAGNILLGSGNNLYFGDTGTKIDGTAGSTGLSFMTASALRMFLDGSGRLKINTNTTTGPKLIVNQAGSNTLKTSGNMTNGFFLGMAGTGSAAFNMGTDGTDTNFNSAFANNAGVARGYKFRTGGTVRLTIATDGTVSGDLNDTSDEKLKKNIVSIADGVINKIKQLRPVNFDWKEEEDSKGHSGFIAQEIKTIIPDLVGGTEYDENTESTGYSVNTYGLVAYLTKALQETISKVEILENKVSTLEGA